MISQFLRECGNLGGIGELKIEMKDEILKKKEKLNEIIMVGCPNYGRPMIQAASSTLRQNESFGRYFTPNVYAFGPIHHSDSDLQRGQIMKVKLALDFLKKFFGPRVRVLELFCEIENKIPEFEAWYEEDKKETARSSGLFFMDGCALLGYMYLSRKFQFVEFCQLGVEICDDDLFLLENQIPYTLLELIISKLSTDGHKVTIRKSIDDFVNLHCHKLGFDFEQKSQIVEKQELVPYHLLDLLWLKAGCSSYPRAAAANTGNPPPDPESEPEPEPEQQTQPQTQKQPRRYSVQELKAFWVKMMPNKNIRLRGLTFVMYGKLSGILEIRPIIVDPSTVKKIENLMAYELCADFPNYRDFISYMFLLGSHIVTVGDVSELRSSGVLQHSLASDQFVLQVFQQVATNLEPNSKLMSYIVEDVDKDIEAYFASPIKFTIASWWNYAAKVYCKNPWTVMALLAAIFGFFLTAVQTYYAVYPKENDSGNKHVHHIRKFLLN